MPNENLGTGTHAIITPPHAVTGGSDTSGKPQKKIVDSIHPEYAAMVEQWIKWRLVYDGGTEFIDKFLFEYSKREKSEDFEIRRQLTYNENHAASIINIIRNAMTAKLPEVVRRGDPIYETIMRSDVDMQKSSMTTFLGLEVLPLLLSQGKRFIGVDAPEVLGIEGQPRTRADDTMADRPYVWAFDAEDMHSWSHDSDGNFLSTLTKETVDVLDERTRLVTDTKTQFRLMQRVGDGFQMEQIGGEGVLSGAGVLVTILDKDDKVTESPRLLQISRIPIVELRLVDSLLKDIAEMQIAMLQLSSADMTFLFRGNFPIFTKQSTTKTNALKPRGSKKRVDSFDEEISERDRITTRDARPNVQEAGVGSGVGYEEKMDRPDFIAPPTENVKVSMEKQDRLAKGMRMLVDLALISMSVKAAEQSGKSKEADRVGTEAGLSYIGTVLETGDREVASLMHEFLSKDGKTEHEVKYPEGFSLKTAEDRQKEAETLRGQRSAVQSPTFAKSVDKRIAEISLRGIATPEEIKAVQDEIDVAPYIDDDPQRSKVVLEDVKAGVVSKRRATVLRAHEESEAAAVMDEEEERMNRAISGQTLPPNFSTEDGDDDDLDKDRD